MVLLEVVPYSVNVPLIDHVTISVRSELEPLVSILILGVESLGSIIVEPLINFSFDFD